MPHVLFAVWMPHFENVAKPNTDGLYLFLLFNIGWEVGKFSEYKPRARKLYNDGLRARARHGDEARKPLHGPQRARPEAREGRLDGRRRVRAWRA